MATQAEVAAHLFLDQAVVSRLLTKGVLPAAGRGQLDLDACRRAYIKHVRASAAGRDSCKPGSLEAQRARLAAAQAETQERKNARERGELVPLADIDANVREFIGRLMTFMDHAPARIAGSDHKLRRRIEAGLNEARLELASTEVVDTLVGASAATPADDEGED